MLHTFLATNQEELIARCRAKVAKRRVPRAAENPIEYGIPRLLDQLVTTLRDVEAGGAQAEPADVPKGIVRTAGKHGEELQHNGFTLDQVVHDYGDLCQALTELAHDTNTPITVDEFHTFNGCLDTAIAGAVTEFGRQRDKNISQASATTLNERLGFLAHQLSSSVNTAMLSFHAIKSGQVAANGTTGGVLDRSLSTLTDLIHRTLAEVRLTAALQIRPESITLRDFLDEVSVFAVMEAATTRRELAVTVDSGLVVEADRQLLASAVANLLRNALKFTPKGGRITLKGRAHADRVLIEITDQCGGHSPDQAEALFHPLTRPAANRTDVGRGLSISRRGVEANGGTIGVRNIPNEGCVFTIDLPRGRGV